MKYHKTKKKIGSKTNRSKLKKHKKKKPMGEEKIGLEDAAENLSNILAGITAQAGFRKTFVETTVRKHVADTTIADALVAELSTGLEKADTAFDTAVKAESIEVDLPPSEDAGDLVRNLYE